MLSYLDFFPTGVQRVAVTTAANICRGLTGESVAVVQEAVPILTNILQYQVPVGQYSTVQYSTVHHMILRR